MAYPGPYHRAVATQYRRILARSVAALMRATPELSSHAKLAKKCSTPTRTIGARTIGHLLNADDGPQPQLDTIVAVAEAFKVAPWMLLHPAFDAETKSVGGEVDAGVLEIARKISALSKDSQQVLLEVFHQPAAAQPQREPLARIKELHEPRPSEYKPRRTSRTK